MVASMRTGAMMKNKHDIYRLYGGLRYAFTSYKYDLTGPEITDPIWGTTSPYEAKDISCNYHWMEILFGVDAKIWDLSEWVGA